MAIDDCRPFFRPGPLGLANGDDGMIIGNVQKVSANSTKIAPPKPRWRGVSHQYAFYLSLVAGVWIIFRAINRFEVPADHLIFIFSVVTFAVSVALLLGTSALYHRVQWSTEARELMRRCDHSSIYLLISGTYTPLMIAALDSSTATTVLSIVWGASFVGIFLELFVKRAPKWLKAGMYVALGWVAVTVTPQIYQSLGLVAVSLIALGGVLYTLGAVVYARKRPNPNPVVFGYHEVFHMFVIGGAVAHYAVVAVYIVSR